MSRTLLGDCIKHLRTMEEDTFDSLVTDPPAGIGFMGKEWDHHKGGRSQWVSWMTEIMRECHRVLKPGAHGLVWALPRTSHWTATALEDAGFEVRDVVTHLFGSGFPKSLDVSKAIDKAAGAEREVVGKSNRHVSGKPSQRTEGLQGSKTFQESVGMGAFITAPATDAARQWQGFGTALKPASEHWILIRKPISEKTVAANVLKWGTGALNIDASRVGFASDADLKATQKGLEAMRGSTRGGAGKAAGDGWDRPWQQDIAKVQANLSVNAQGRFPANLVLSHDADCLDDECSLFCPVRMLDEQSGKLSSGAWPARRSGIGYQGGNGTESGSRRESSEGGASRFFYVAKISKSERNAGLEGMNRNFVATMNRGIGAREHDPSEPSEPSAWNQNSHPTVKPKKLMTYLIRMVTPPGGAVLDPFMGSGSTGVAASEAGYTFMGIEQEPDYYEIATKRIQSAGVTR